MNESRRELLGKHVGIACRVLAMTLLCSGGAQAQFTILYEDFCRFCPGNLTFPTVDLAISGTTVFGTDTANRNGAIWSFDTATDSFTTLYHFDGDEDGEEPGGGVAMSGTTLFGTTEFEGANGRGTIWSFDTATDTFTVLHDFNRFDGPVGGLAMPGTTLFGTTGRTIWSLDTVTNTFTNLHDFAAAGDGGVPRGRLAVSDMKLFGTTDAWSDGSNGDGLIWSFDIASSIFTRLHVFEESADGGRPYGGVAMSGTTLFGAAQFGGANEHGTVWSLDTSTDRFTTLHHFDGMDDGMFPVGDVAMSGTTLFGTTWAGGANNAGTVWSFDTASDTFTTLHEFNVIDGTLHRGGVAFSGTTLFGTTPSGGANGNGTLWALVVPEPSSFSLVAMAILTLAARRSRQCRRAL